MSALTGNTRVASTALSSQRKADVDYGADRLSSLTEREREVLDLIAAGFTNREIARHMFISEKTVKNHITRLLLKCQVRNRTEAAVFVLSSTNGAHHP